MFARIIFLLCGLALASAGRLQVNGTQFDFDGQHVFLAGSNLPWVEFYLGTDGWDATAKQTYIQELTDLADAGANSIRVWVHGEARHTPVFDSYGFVTGLDNQGNATFISHFTEILDIAQQHNILVFPLLWDARPAGTDKLHQLVLDETKLQSYITNALTPWVNAVKDHPALGGWDIVSDPEAKLIPNEPHTDPCYDTTPLYRRGPGWVAEVYNVEKLQRFINLQAAAIKAADPTALVTVGTWDPRSSIDSHGFHNFYKDECLVKSGGDPQGTLDFYQFHQYAGPFGFDYSAIFYNTPADYNSTKPIVVGEFWEDSAAGLTDYQMIDYIYNNNYHGAWVYVHTVREEFDSAIKSISQLTTNGVIPITV